MRRIMYDGNALVTSAEVASALMAYAADVVRFGGSATVDVPALESNGSIGTHSILIGPATQLEIVDIDGEAGAVSEDQFPMPEFTPLVHRAAPVPSSAEDELVPGLGDDVSI